MLILGLTSDNHVRCGLFSLLEQGYSILIWYRLRGKDAWFHLGASNLKNFLVIVGNFFDATLYVIVRFGVSLKWVLYSHTI